MSRLKNMVFDLQEAVASGKPFEEIARNFDVPVRWVIDAANMMDTPDPDYMDGDAASALASAGYGMDEDYGYFGDEF